MKKDYRNARSLKRSMAFITALTLVCMAVLAGGAFAGAFRTSSPALAEAGTEPVQDTSPAIYVSQKNANSVVGVLTYAESWSRSTNTVQEQLQGQGSGVVIADGGIVLTNYHVIENGTAFKVLMPDGNKTEATIVGTDSATDLAVLKVSENADQLVPVTIGSSESLVVGSTVIAIGNPGGEVLANTVTQGIVSALERTSVNSSNTSRRISYIQHDAPINSGNSGGGLFNYRGELVGINTLKYSGSLYASTSYEGLGFAIPVDTVWKVAQQLMEKGKVERPGLGVTVMNYTDGPDEPLVNNAPTSVLIMSVMEGGAAAKAGLQQYDFIYEVDGQRVNSRLDLTGILDEHEVGDTISVKVVRYAQAGYQQTSNYNDIFGGYGFGYGFGYGYGYGNGNNGMTDPYANQEFVVSGGFEYVTVDVTLDVLQSE
ncbi:MAG: trypsin-like peptidase domain-containing protein [Clostridia bacterium]|nr:trypsin-like peptidase domain-containing protein [Clostridia bacterium]